MLLATNRTEQEQNRYQTGIISKTLKYFPAVLVETKPDILDETLGNI